MAVCTLEGISGSRVRIKLAGTSMIASAENLAMGEAAASMLADSPTPTFTLNSASKNGVQCYASAGGLRLIGDRVTETFPAGRVEQVVELDLKDLKDADWVHCLHTLM